MRPRHPLLLGLPLVALVAGGLFVNASSGRDLAAAQLSGGASSTNGSHKVKPTPSASAPLPSATATSTANPTATPTATSTPAPTPSASAPLPSATATSTASPTATPTATSTSAPTPSVAPGPTPTASATPVPSATPAAAGTGTYLFGTLLTDASRSAGEYAAGVRVVHLELGWDQAEPQDGVFNTTYMAQAKQQLATMRNAGLRVVLGAGLQYPPSWAFNYSNSRYVDQFGRTAGTLNLTFNSVLRGKADAYLSRLNADLGLNNFWAVRIGSGANVEVLYPGHDADGINSNAYWAFDANAQASAPMLGWHPGQTTWNGQPVTASNVRTWYEWYVSQLTGGVNWQLATYRNLGFGGFLQVLLPGQGTRPLDYEKNIAGYLNGSADGNRTMSRGAAWDQVLARIANKANVVAYVSSLADGSGWDDVCQAADSTVSLTSSQIGLWSAARWVSYLANKYGLAKNGENPGPNDTNAYGTTMLSHAVAQMKACGFQGMFWAHDTNLYLGTGGVTLAAYSTVIAAN